MTVDELIQKLEALRATHGDQYLYVPADGRPGKHEVLDVWVYSRDVLISIND